MVKITKEEKTLLIPWYQQKTTQWAIAGVLTALAGYLTGEIGIPGLIASIFAAGGVIFGRQGIEKSRLGVPPLAKRGETIE